jgi:hypothetical protein
MFVFNAICMLSVIKPISFNQYRDPKFFEGEIEPAMINTAREAANNRARSWRNFHVGACGAVAIGGDVVFADGANNSPERGDPRDCAEMDVLRFTDQHPGAVLLDLYVAGPDDRHAIKEAMGLESPTLHPCSECRGLLRDHPAAQGDTGIVTFGLHPDSTALERASLEQVLALYEGLEPPKTSGQVLVTAGAALLRYEAHPS